MPDEIKPKGRFCRDCIRKHRLEYHRTYYKDYYAKNRDAVKAKTNARRRANPEFERARNRRYAAANRERERERAKRWYEEHREHHNKRVAEWKRRNPEEQQKYQRAYWARLKSDPERWAAYLESQRMWRRLRDERAGRPSPPLSEVEYIERYGKPSHRDVVPVAPLFPYLESWFEFDFANRLAGSRVGGRAGNNTDTILAGQSVLAEKAGVSERRIYAIRSGEQENIMRDTADRLCIALGVSFSFVYMEDEEEAA